MPGTVTDVWFTEDKMDTSLGRYVSSEWACLKVSDSKYNNISLFYFERLCELTPEMHKIGNREGIFSDQGIGYPVLDLSPVLAGRRFGFFVGPIVPMEISSKEKSQREFIAYNLRGTSERQALVIIYHGWRVGLTL